jgi:hypothetical protein
MEVPGDKDGKFIRATLASYNLPISTTKENRRLLEAYGALIGKKVVYTQNEAEKLTEKILEPKARKVIKTKSACAPSLPEKLEIVGPKIRKVIKTKK